MWFCEVFDAAYHSAPANHANERESQSVIGKEPFGLEIQLAAFIRVPSRDSRAMYCSGLGLHCGEEADSLTVPEILGVHGHSPPCPRSQPPTAKHVPGTRR